MSRHSLSQLVLGLSLVATFSVVLPETANAADFRSPDATGTSSGSALLSGLWDAVAAKVGLAIPLAEQAAVPAAGKVSPLPPTTTTRGGGIDPDGAQSFAASRATSVGPTRAAAPHLGRRQGPPPARH